MTFRVATLSAIVAISAIAACFSKPRLPPPGPRVAEIADRGRIKFVRDGRVIDSGLFGGGLVTAVHGNVVAEQAARTFVRRNTIGKSFMMISAPIALTAILAFYAPDSGTVLEPPGLVLVGASVTGFYTGLLFYRNAQTYRYDAINIFNADYSDSAPQLKIHPDE